MSPSTDLASQEIENSCDKQPVFKLPQNNTVQKYVTALSECYLCMTLSLSRRVVLSISSSWATSLAGRKRLGVERVGVVVAGGVGVVAAVFGFLRRGVVDSDTSILAIYNKLHSCCLII